MRRFTTNALLALLILALSMGCAFAAKTPPKKPTSSTHHETLGTQQLKGEFGKIGDTYTLGKSNPWNVKLSSAEYTVASLRVGDGLKFPNMDEKFLVLHFTVHNPQKGLALMRFDTFRITAVDSSSKNWEGTHTLNLESTKEAVSQNIKPAQKIDVYKVVVVPAAGEIPKIIVTGSDNLVIRYDLLGKVKPLPEPFADPNDKTGATALAVVPAKIGVTYDAGCFTVSVDGISYSEGPINGKNAGPGGRFLVLNMTAKNINTFPLPFRFDTFRFKGADMDGADLDWGRNILRASSDKTLSMTCEIGQEIKFRTYYIVEKGVTPMYVRVAGGANPRVFQYTVE